MNVIRDYYEEKSPLCRINKRRREKLLKILDRELDNKKILDVGCAGGLSGEFLKRKNNYLAGIDISSQAILQAKKFFDQAIILDIENEDLPFPGNYFDIIIFSEIISHLFFPEKAIIKIKNVLKDEGKIVITAPNFLVWTNRIRMFFGGLKYTEETLVKNGVIHFFNYDSLKEILKKTGLKVIQEEFVIHPRVPQWFGKFFPNLFAFQIILKAKKAV